MLAKGFSSVFLALGKRLREVAQQRPPVCGSFALANAHSRRQSQELGTPIRNRRLGDTTTPQHKAVTIQPNQRAAQLDERIAILSYRISQKERTGVYCTLVSINTLVPAGEDRIAYDHLAQRPRSATAFVFRVCR